MHQPLWHALASGPAVWQAVTAQAILVQKSLNETMVKITVSPAKTHTTTNQRQDLVLVYTIAQNGQVRKRVQKGNIKLRVS